MFGVLIESKAKAPRRSGGALLSVVAHTAGLTLAVALTAQADPKAIGDRWTRPLPPVTWVPVAATPPGRADAGGKTIRPCDCVRIPHTFDFQGKIPPTNVDVVGQIPGVPSGSSFWGDTLAALGRGSIDTARTEPWSVSETSARVLRSARPRYPELLRAAGVSGRVLVRFVVDTSGRVESMTVIQTSHDLFTRAVRDVMPTMRLIPAEVGGRRVPMLAEMAFEFALDRR